LKNSGKYDGAEIVQLYIRDLVGSNTRPVKELKGFQKVFLKAGESKTVTFNVTPEDLKFYDNNLKYDWESGEFEIFVGGDSQKTVSQKSLGINKSQKINERFTFMKIFVPSHCFLLCCNFRHSRKLIVILLM
jgi:hypothetical protein